MLPEINLDDRSFQDLFNEARLRIARACPEWTEHNVSDPGITLLEAFASMTEMLIYRINRAPDKLHVRLLELLGIGADPPAAAMTDLRFTLSAPATEAVTLPAGIEAATFGRGAEAVVFRVTDELTIPAARLIAYAVQRGGALQQLDTDQGVARPPFDAQRPFGAPPQPGDALYLGFDQPLSRLVLHLEFDVSPATGHVDPRDPPLRWEALADDGGWEAVEVLTDETGGFTLGGGAIDVQVPASAAEGPVGRRRAHWIRGSVTESFARSGAASYAVPPEIYSATGVPIGALAPAVHAATSGIEILGTSDGTPGQRFRLRHAPVLRLGAGEGLEVRDPATDEWQPWQVVESFADSDAFAAHYVLDATAGVVELGPTIRDPIGGWNQYGAVPPRGAQMRMRSYTYGGGRQGNVDAGTVTVLQTPLDGIASVTNPRSARGGADAETLDEIRMRAPFLLRSRDRAVTASDYEYLCLSASPRVARALCVPAEGGLVQVHLVPRTYPADRMLSYDELVPDESLLAEVEDYIDGRRPAGVSVDLLPANFRGVAVVASVQALPNADPVRVEQDLAQALYTYLNPLVGGSLLGQGSGWAFGRALNQGELYGVMQAVDGVAFVRLLSMSAVDLLTGEVSPSPTGVHIAIEPHELVASGMHVLQVVREQR